jgi:hypothetical protein
MEQTRGALAAALREDRERGPAPAPEAPPTRTARAPVAPPTPEAFPTPEDRPLGSLVEVEAAWDRLTTELATTRTRYQTLLTRKFELQAILDTVNTTGSDVLRVIDPPSLAVDPEPPGKTRLSLMVLAAATALALGLAGLSGFLDTRLYQPADLRRWGELPELPVIPDIHEAHSANVMPMPSPHGPERRR